MKTFRAWIDWRGGNQDLEHTRYCEGPLPLRCDHLRLVDWETNSGRIVLRFTWRRRPLHLYIGQFVWMKRIPPYYNTRGGRTVLKIGKERPW